MNGAGMRGQRRMAVHSWVRSVSFVDARAQPYPLSSLTKTRGSVMKKDGSLRERDKREAKLELEKSCKSCKFAARTQTDTQFKRCKRNPTDDTETDRFQTPGN